MASMRWEWAYVLEGRVLGPHDPRPPGLILQLVHGRAAIPLAKDKGLEQTRRFLHILNLHNNPGSTRIDSATGVMQGTVRPSLLFKR